MGKRIKTSGASEFFKQLDEDARRGVAALNGLLEDPAHRTGRAVAAAELDGDTVKTLDFKGVLHRIVDGWYYVDEPGRWEWDDPMPWKMAFWHFVAAYLDGKYGERWCLGADDSLMFRAENGVFPHELTVRTPDDETHAVSLPWGYEVLVIKASIPEGVETEGRFGLRLYPLERALLLASPGFYYSHQMEARTCLAILRNELAMTDMVTNEFMENGAGRLAGGLKSIGRDLAAQNITDYLNSLKIEVNVVNPFREDVKVYAEDSAIAARINLMWMRMREHVLDESPGPCSVFRSWTPSQVKAMMDGIYVRDAVASLRLDGFTITEDTVRAVAEGKWKYEVMCKETEEENVAAAAGYLDAYRLARTDILDSLTGGAEPGKMLSRFLDWHGAMAAPFERNGLEGPGTPHRYRSAECYIEGSEHLPVGPEDVPYAMDALSLLLEKEPDTFVRAVLGTFFLDYIRPVQQVSGTLSRLFMNSQLVCGGYPWTVITVDREKYEGGLEEGSVDIWPVRFARLVGEQVGMAKEEIKKSR